MQTLKLRDEFIKLGQALKAAGLVESGVYAKFVIQDGLVKVNGNVEILSLINKLVFLTGRGRIKFFLQYWHDPILFHVELILFGNEYYFLVLIRLYYFFV